jgi:SAM-dependent methyltransferase
LRLIEIGAGTGASSERILARLASEGLRPAEYVYTDVSKAFLFHAETRYGAEAEADFLRYDLLDIEHPLPAESPHVGRYDVAIAANVLHATGDILDTLRNAKALLRPGGLLLINEIAENTLPLHLTFGLLDGWWLHRDPALRAPGGPALSPEGWRRALTGVGFSPAVWPMSPLHRLGYQIVVAQSDGGVLLPHEPSARESAVTAQPEATRDAGIDPKARLAAWLAADKRLAMLELSAHLRGVAGEILGLREEELDSPSRPFPDAMLGALGMDSLLASNLRNHLLKDLEVDIPVQVLIGEPVSAVVDQIYQQLLLRQLSAAPADRQVDGDFETLVF